MQNLSNATEMQKKKRENTGVIYSFPTVSSGGATRGFEIVDDV